MPFISTSSLVKIFKFFFGLKTLFWPVHVLRTSESTTGVAPIMVADDGMNSIVIIPGANMLLTPDEVQAAFIAIKKPKVSWKIVCNLNDYIVIIKIIIIISFL